MLTEQSSLYMSEVCQKQILNFWSNYTVPLHIPAMSCSTSIKLNKKCRVFLLVVVKPRVSVTPRRQIVDVADTVEFRCSASAGFPAPTLRWLRGEGRQLPHLSKFFSRSGIFKILAASRRDEGEYMCTASNSGGESVMRVQLLVKGKLHFSEDSCAMKICLMKILGVCQNR